VSGTAPLPNLFLARLTVIVLCLAEFSAAIGSSAISAQAAATAGASGRLDTFVRGGDAALWHRQFDGTTWGNWESLGGVLTADPAAVASPSGGIDVFSRGPDHALIHRAFDGTNWGSWESLGGVLDSGPAVASWAAGHLDVFALGLDDAVMHRAFDNGAWGNWESLHGGFNSNPGAFSIAAGRIDVFARGLDNAIWHATFNNAAWTGWESLGGGLTSGPGVTSSAAGRLDMFAVGRDRAIWSRSWDGTTWGQWASVGGVLTSDPAGVSGATGRIDVFARGGDNALWHRTFTTTWGAWESVGGQVVAGTDPMVISVPVWRQTMNLDCETAALQMALASLGHTYSQAALFALENPDTRPPVKRSDGTIAQWGDPYTNFVGNVNGNDSIPTGYGIYYPVILSIAQNNGAPGSTGGEANTAAAIYSALAQGHPVVAWVEVGWYRPRLGTWTAWDGRAVRYSLDEHSVVLSGLSASQVRVNDPWHGTQYWVSKAVFEQSWADFNNMAIIFK
jgi:uncharacterized protein YvpB